MKRISSNELIDQLVADTRNILNKAIELEHLENSLMQKQPAPGRWSVAQVLEHLNFYSRHYIKAIGQKLHNHGTSASSYFSPGWFGNYFTKMMQPKPNGTIPSKMKALKSATPPPSIDGKAALRQFIEDQHTLLNLLQAARWADIGRLRIPTSISKMVSLKLGDTFRFFIAHEQRHMQQIANTLNSIKPAEQVLG